LCAICHHLGQFEFQKHCYADLVCALFGPYAAMFVNWICPGKSLKTRSVSPSKPWNLVFESPGKSWRNSILLSLQTLSLSGELTNSRTESNLVVLVVMIVKVVVVTLPVIIAVPSIHWPWKNKRCRKFYGCSICWLCMTIVVVVVPFNGLFSKTTWVSQHQKSKQLYFIEARDDGCQWHQLNHMQIICNSLQTDSHTSTLSLNFFKGRPGRMLFLNAQPTVSKCWRHYQQKFIFYFKSRCALYRPEFDIT